MKHTIVSLALLISIAGQAHSQDWRDPLGVIDDAVPVPHFASVVLPIAAVTAALLLTRDTRDQGGWSVRSQAGYFRSYHHEPTDVLEVSAGGSLFLRTWMAVGADFHVTILSDVRMSTTAIGIRPNVRWYFPDTGPFRLYFEQGLGVLYTMRAFPPGGTRVNFSPTYGLGISVRVGQMALAELQARHYHISNANLIAGPDRNPGFDSNGIALGIGINF